MEGLELIGGGLTRIPTYPLDLFWRVRDPNTPSTLEGREDVLERDAKLMQRKRLAAAP